MNIKSTIAAIALAATSVFAAPVEASIEDTAIRKGNVAGFSVIATDTPYWDTIVVPFHSRLPGVVLVRCSTGDYRYNSNIGADSARLIATDWCN